MIITLILFKNWFIQLFLLIFRSYYQLFSVWLSVWLSWFVDIVTVVVVTTTSHWEISLWFAWSISCACKEGLFLIFNAIIKRDIPSKTVEIHIQIHAHVLDSLFGTQIIIMAKTNNKHHSQTIHHRRGWIALLFKPKIINITHLINAHMAKIQIIIVHTSWDHEKISQNQIKASNNPQIQSNQTSELFLFLNALITADTPAVNKKNHNIISINFQNILGEQIVTIQKIIITTDNDSISQNGRACFVPELFI